MSSPGPDKPCSAVELRGLCKTFGNVAANSDVSLKAMPGTVHALIGENGAGKSTAMKMLYGIYRPDSGQILIDGEPREWSSPSDAIRAGIGMVHQHFMLADPYTAIENIVLGAEDERAYTGRRPGFLQKLGGVLRDLVLPMDLERARRKLGSLSERYGLKASWDSPVGELPVGVQQRLEILKLLYRDARILIFDEPTAVLTPQETTELFVQLRKLCGEGKTIFIITHKLKEVMALADEVTILRAGKVVGHRKVSETTPEELASLMVGRKMSLMAEVPPPAERRGVALQAEGLTLAAGSRKRLDDLSFSVESGEIVGIAGVEGNGQSELLQFLMHPEDVAQATLSDAVAGRISFFGKEIFSPKGSWATEAIRELGVAIIPEDRHRQGLMLDQPVRDNFLLGLQRRAPFKKGPLLVSAALDRAVAAAIEEYDVRPPSAEVNAGNLSGGNQQKLIIARELAAKPRFLIAAHPTRGVDIGAIEFIHGRLLEARSQGMGVLLISSELDEIFALSDRILVMYAGRIVAQFARGECDEQRIGMFMGGATK